MTKLALIAVALLPLAGCDSSKNTAAIRYIITPDVATHSVSVTCSRSSSDTCHFALTGAASPSEAAVKVGNTFVFHNTDDNTLYCAEIARPTLGTCDESSIPPKRQNVTKRVSRSEGQ